MVVRGEGSRNVYSVLLVVCWQMSCYILNRVYIFFFTEGVNVVHSDFLNIHIMCAGGD